MMVGCSHCKEQSDRCHFDMPALSSSSSSSLTPLLHQVSLPTGQPSAGGVVPAGALSAYTSRLLSSSEFKSVRDVMKGISGLMPAEMQTINAKIDEYARGIISGEQRVGRKKKKKMMKTKAGEGGRRLNRLQGQRKTAWADL